MEKIKIFLGASILLLASAQANAVIIGDKDWRQVADRPTAGGYIGYLWTDFDAVFDTTTGECDVVGCLIERPFSEDVDLTGYIWASNTEVNELFKSYLGGTGLDSLNSDNSKEVGEHGLNSFFDDFDYTYADVPTSGQALGMIYGWTRNQSPGESDLADVMYAWNYNIGPEYQPTTLQDSIGLDVHNDMSCTLYDCRLGKPGGWFYKKIGVVPAPPVIWLFGIGLIGFVLSRRKIKT